jgi:hypothetical protein
MLIEQYIFITIFFASFAFFIYIHVAYPFWVHMPVSHTYDLHHKLFSGKPNIQVLQQYPYKNKWVCSGVQGTLEVRSVSYHDSTDVVKDHVLDQLNCNYIPSDSILFTIEKKHLDVLFSGHFDTPFVTTYVYNSFVKTKEGPQEQKTLGCIASYPVRILYHNEKTASNFMVFLACDRDNPKRKEITRNLIATHEYNSRNRVTDIKTTILKKHTGSCAGVKPLLEFSTTLYYIGLLGVTNKSQVQQVYKQNWSLMQDIAELLPRLFEFCAYMDVGALKARVDAGQLWIFCLKHEGNIVAAYFIEDAMMLYEKVNDYGGKTLNLVASICNMKDGSEGPQGTQKSIRPFVRGFMECLALIQKQNRDYTMLLMDDVGHNNLLAKETRLVPRGPLAPLVKTAGAYYMINGFVKEPVNADRAFIMI